MPQSNQEIAIARGHSVKKMFQSALTAFEKINSAEEVEDRTKSDWRLIYFFLRAWKIPSKYTNHLQQQREELL